jgi:hypothetical protein
MREENKKKKKKKSTLSESEEFRKNLGRNQDLGSVGLSI